jgi:hypothetical protein
LEVRRPKVGNPKSQNGDAEKRQALTASENCRVQEIYSINFTFSVSSARNLIHSTMLGLLSKSEGMESRLAMAIRRLEASGDNHLQEVKDLLAQGAVETVL